MSTLTAEAIQKQVLSNVKGTISKAKFRSNRGQRTKLLKDALCRLGHENRYAVYSSGTETAKSDFHEWMWDLVWAEQSKKKFYESGYQAVIELPLIAEMEWGISEADRIDDFEKLRVGVAELRLFICGSENVEDAKKAIDLCRHRLCKSSPKKTKARYLLVAINRNTNTIDACESWTW